jgi:signal transduction histidine kinase
MWHIITKLTRELGFLMNGIKIKVIGNGLGMESDMQKRIFDMFYRGTQPY